MRGIDDRTLARGMALNTVWLREQDFGAKFEKGVRKFKLDVGDAQFLNSVFRTHNTGGRLYWSNRHVKRAAAEALIDAFLDDCAKNERRKRWLGTFAWNDGITPERQPNVDIVSMKGKVDKAMRMYGLEGIGIVEVDVMTPITGEPGRLLLFHIHVYCWTEDGRNFDHTAAADELMVSRRFPNRLGAPSVSFKPVNAYDISVARIAGYVTKFQPGAKNRIPSRKKPGKYRLRGTMKGFTPDAAVRLVEVMSHLEVHDVIFSVGASGRELRDAWHEKFMTWARSRRRRTKRGTGGDWDVGVHWRSIRADNGSKMMRPCRIVTRVAQRHLCDW